MPRSRPSGGETPEGLLGAHGPTYLRLFRRFPTRASVPGFPALGRTDAPLESVLRLRGIPPSEALRQVREDLAHLEADLRGLRDRSDPRRATLEPQIEGAERLEHGLVRRQTRLWEVLWGLRESSQRGRLPTLAGTQGALESEGARFWNSRYRSAPFREALRPGGETRPEWFHRLDEEGLAALLPLWEDRAMELEGVLLGMHAQNGTPVFLDRFRHPHHSSAILGETGSGKSYASALGVLRARWAHPDLSVFVLDPLGGLARFVGLLGGHVVVPGRGALPINPLDPATSGGDVRRKIATVSVMLRALYPSLHDEEAAVLDVTMEELYRRSGARTPQLGDLLVALRQRLPSDHRLLALLQTAVTGSLAGLDGPTRWDLGGPLWGFDLSRITPAELPFLLVLLLDFIEGELRKREGPKLLIIDEVHYLFRSSATAGYLDQLVRHVRHFRTGVELLSQSPNDLTGSAAGRAILANLDSLLLLRLREGGRSLGAIYPLAEEERASLRAAPLPRDQGYSGGLLLSGGRHLPVAILASPAEDALLRAGFDREGSELSETPSESGAGAPDP